MIKQCSIHGLLTSMLLIVFSLMSNDAIAQKAIRGTVLDEANEPIIGASVLVKGTTNGSITGVDGTFNVKANPSDVLVISYVGYATVEQQVGNQTQLVIHLREDSKVLNDVVVIGYGSTTKKELTGSVTSMKKDDLNPGTFTNAMGMLQGKVAARLDSKAQVRIPISQGWYPNGHSTSAKAPASQCPIYPVHATSKPNIRLQ